MQSGLFVQSGLSGLAGWLDHYSLNSRASSGPGPGPGPLDTFHQSISVSPHPPLSPLPFCPTFSHLSLSSATFYKIFDLVNASVKCFPHQMFRVKRLFCKNPFAPGCCCWWAPPPQATAHQSCCGGRTGHPLLLGANWSWYWVLCMHWLTSGNSPFDLMKKKWYAAVMVPGTPAPNPGEVVWTANCSKLLLG